MQESVTAIIKELLGSMGLTHSDIVYTEVAGQPVFSIKTDDSQTLIGVRGDTIRAFEAVVKRIAEQRGIERPLFIVDVNDYQLQHIKELQDRARMMAGRARSLEYDVELPPMSAYERLIVHATLSEEPNVKTESHGEGRDRRLIIKYTKEETPVEI